MKSENVVHRLFDAIRGRNEELLAGILTTDAILVDPFMPSQGNTPFAPSRENLSRWLASLAMPPLQINWIVTDSGTVAIGWRRADSAITHLDDGVMILELPGDRIARLINYHDPSSPPLHEDAGIDRLPGRESEPPHLLSLVENRLSTETGQPSP